MPFGLTIGTERANALQQSIQDELIQRAYSSDADPVMAEYITIMVINNKTAAQITAELEDLIGSEFDPAFTDWLFAEAAKGANETESSSQPLPPTSPSQPSDLLSPRDPPPHVHRDSSNRPAHAPRNALYQQAVSQATSSTPAQKRTSSARSPSPSHPNKSRRTDLPTGPRAMQRDGGSGPNPRSLLDRMGGHAGPNRHHHDEIQARIDNITNGSSEPNMMMAGSFPGMPMGGMEMSAMAMANPLMLQDMFLSNMALMQQLSTQIGMMQSFTNGPPGFNMPGGLPADMGMFPGAANNFVPGSNRGARGGARGRSNGRGRGGSQVGAASLSASKSDETTAGSESITTPNMPPVAGSTVPTPAPTIMASVAVSNPPTHPIPYATPDRPQSPTLCKFGLKCTNPQCRWSHPSPVATLESGVVLSNEACEKGKDCQDKDCIKAHVSPAVVNPTAQPPPAAAAAAPAPVVHHIPPNSTPCRFGLACTRPNCMFTHRHPTSNPQYAQPCRFGASCTRVTCLYQHPEGRVLPTSFHRGLSTKTPIGVPNLETGSIGPSPHKSMTFNNTKAKLEKQVKEAEEKKNEAEKVLKETQAAAANGKEELKPVATAA